jgi:hypothetical protein
MGATVAANKDAVEKRMFYVLSSPNKKVFVAKKWISLLSAREDVKNGQGRDLAALRYLRESELTRKCEKDMDIYREKKKRGGGGERGGRGEERGGYEWGLPLDRVF